MLFRKPPPSPFLSAAMGFGYTLLAACVVLGYLGHLGDGRWGTYPWLMITGIFLGLATAFKSLMGDLAKAAAYEKAQKQQASKEDKSPR